MNWLKIVLWSICLGLIWIIYQFFFTTGHPSDKNLLLKFEQSRAKYETLVTMFEQDGLPQVIAPDWTRPSNVIPTARWQEYRVLFSELELEGGLRSLEGGTIKFIASAGGLPSANSGKGYMFKPKNPQATYDNLNKFPDTRMSYRKIDEDWYLFLHWTD